MRAEICMHKALEELAEICKACMHKKRNGRKYDLRKGSADVGPAWIWQSAVLSSALLFTLGRALDHFIVLLLKKGAVFRALCCASSCVLGDLK